eukprot:UN19855
MQNEDENCAYNQADSVDAGCYYSPDLGIESLTWTELVWTLADCAEDTSKASTCDAQMDCVSCMEHVSEQSGEGEADCLWNTQTNDCHHGEKADFQNPGFNIFSADMCPADNPCDAIAPEDIEQPCYR